MVAIRCWPTSRATTSRVRPPCLSRCWTSSRRSIYTDSLRFRGGRQVESQVIRLAPDSVSLGELRLVVGSGPQQRTVSALVSFSQAWVVTNFDEMLDLLRYFGQDDADQCHAQGAGFRAIPSMA